MNNNYRNADCCGNCRNYQFNVFTEGWGFCNLNDNYFKGSEESDICETCICDNFERREYNAIYENL